MGNKSSTSTSTRSTTGCPSVRDVKEHIKLLNKETQKNAYVILEPQSNIKKFVPKIYDIQHSTILARRRKLPKITKSVSAEIVIDHTQDDLSLVVAKKYSHSSCDLTLRMPSSPEKELDIDSADFAPDSTFSEDLPTVKHINL